MKTKVLADKMAYLIRKRRFFRTVIKSVNSMSYEDKEKYKKEIDWINNHSTGGALHTFYYQYPWTEKYNRHVPVYKKYGMYYVNDEYEGKLRPLFFTKDKFARILVRRNYNFMCMEQDIHSPHSYLSDNFNIPEDCILLDIGAADGMFTLRHIDEVRKAYIFECDDKWIKALEKTFLPYKDKVSIVNKYVGSSSGGQCITLDKFYESLSDDEKDNLFIKMDIEGTEIESLNNARSMLGKCLDIQLAVCTYHRPGDFETIKSIFSKEMWELEESEGYICCDLNGFEYPYYRKGMLRIKKS